MLRKYCKLWLFMLVMSLIACLPVSAKEMTVKEIGELIDAKGDNTINTARVIGGYVFTNASGVPFEIYDIMLASRSINVPTGDKADRTKMVIYEINRVWDENDNPTWEINSKNFIGEGTIAKDEKVDIKYIDYEKVNEDSTLSTFEINLYSGEYLGFMGNHSTLQMNDGVLNGLIVKDTEISANIEKTNYYFAYTIRVENATNDVIIKVGDTTYHKSDLNGDELTLLQPISSNDVKKELEIIVDLDGNGNKYSETKKTINWEGVNYQQETSGVVVSEKIPSKDIETFKKAPYGYDNTNDTYKITCDGVNCTISGDIYKQTVHDDAFGSANKDGWFILLNIALDGVSNKTIFTVPDNGGSKNIKGVEGESLSLLYKLKDTGDKTFTITVDLDGDEDNYLPVTYTFNYESAELKGSVVLDSTKTDVTIPNDSNIDDGYISDSDRETLTSWGFDFSKLGNVSISDGDGEYTYKLTGSIKEQEVNAGFLSNKGFYIPLKIYFVSDKYQQYYDKWVVYVKGEDGEFIKRVPSHDDYENGFMTVLYKVYDEGHPVDSKKEIEYKIDFDGDGEKFNFVTLKISYEDLEFIHEHTVTFMSKGKVVETQKVYTNEKIKDVTSDEINNMPYHTFKNWETCSDNECSVFDGTVKSDVTLYAQYEVDFDEFVTDLISNQDTNEDEDDNFVLTKNENTINFAILKANVGIEELEKINLFKAMAESLKTGEIKKLRVTSGEDKVEFTNENSESIASSVIELIKKVNEGATKLEDIPEDFSFSIIIVEHDPLITYKDTNTTYEFKFVNNIDYDNLSVTSKELLNTALGSNSPVINIGDSFTIDSLTGNLKEINRSVIINGHGHTITYTGSDNYIFNITDGTVVIDDLKIVVDREDKENIDAIKISNGANVTLSKVTMPDTKGIVVDNAHVTVSEITFASESYDNPLIRALKENTRLTNVVLNRGNNKFATEKIYEEKVTYEDGNKEFYGDTLREKEGYNYRHYYLNGDNENKWIKISYHGDRSLTSFAGVFVRYYDKTSGASAPVPPMDSNLMNFKDDNYTYETTAWCKTYERNDCEDVNSLKPTADIEYWPKTQSTPRSDKAIVNDENELLEALQNESYKVIYINSDIELNSPLNITRSVKLIGYEGSGSHANKLSNAKTITGQIIINADGVIFTNLKVVGKGTKNGARLDVITVNKTKFVLSNVMVSASEGTWDSAVYYTVDNPDTYIGDFSTFVGDNLKSFVEFMGSVDSGTDILNITFKGKKSSDTVTVTPTSHIIIHKLSEGANIILRQIHFQFENATDYALKLYGLAEATNNGSIQIYSNYFTGSNGDKFRIGIETDVTNKNASSYTINPTEKANSSLEVKYINDGEEQDHNTFGTEATVEVK